MPEASSQGGAEGRWPGDARYLAQAEVGLRTALQTNGFPLPPLSLQATRIAEEEQQQEAASSQADGPEQGNALDFDESGRLKRDTQFRAESLGIFQGTLVSAKVSQHKGAGRRIQEGERGEVQGFRDGKVLVRWNEDPKGNDARAVPLAMLEACSLEGNEGVRGRRRRSSAPQRTRIII